MIYLVICKLIVFLKTRNPDFAAQIETDPFLQLLVNCEDDFLANDNMIMMVSTLKMTSNMVIWLAILSFYRSDME